MQGARRAAVAEVLAQAGPQGLWQTDLRHEGIQAAPGQEKIQTDPLTRSTSVSILKMLGHGVAFKCQT